MSILRESLYKVHEDYGRLQGAKPPKPNELLTLAKKNPDTLYLEYSLMNENSTLLFALSASGGLKSFEIPVGEEELQDQEQAWRFAMNAGAQARGDSDDKKSAGDKSQAGGAAGPGGAAGAGQTRTESTAGEGAKKAEGPIIDAEVVDEKK